MAQGRISERGRLEVKFRATPPVKTRKRLHDAGFTWSPKGRLWWAERDPTSDALYTELVKEKPARKARPNPDWSALARQSGELVSSSVSLGARASADGASRAAAWAAPHLRRGAKATWDGARRTGATVASATSRGARRAARFAAPHVVKGLRSGATGIERWASGLRENPSGRPMRRLDWAVTGSGPRREYVLSITEDGADEPLAFDSGNLAMVAPSLNLASAASRADFAQGMVYDHDLEQGDLIELWRTPASSAKAPSPSPEHLDTFRIDADRKAVRPVRKRAARGRAQGRTHGRPTARRK